MMELPKNGKVVIIDDRRNEVEPLIDILSCLGVSTLFFDGSEEKLPTQPLRGVRMVFLDLRFSINTDEKTVIANARQVLKRIIGNDNGPYLLVTWSSTGDDYVSGLKDTLEQEKEITPEAIVPLSKEEFFETERTNDKLINEIIEIVGEETDLDVSEEHNIRDRIESFLDKNIDESKKVFVQDKFGDLSKAIDEAIKKAGILSLFVVWENAIQDSGTKIVANVCGAVNDEVPHSQRLMAVANSLSFIKLEKRFDSASREDRLKAAFLELNDLFAHFYEDETNELEKRIDIDLLKENKQALCSKKLNTWKILRSQGNNLDPGGVFIDEQKLFGWVELDKAPKSTDKKEIEKKAEEFAKKIKDSNIADTATYVCVNVNGECETAQIKAKFIKMVPGVIVDTSSIAAFSPKDLGKKDNLCVLGPFEFWDEENKETRESYMIFSLNQCTYAAIDELKNKMLFRLNQSYYLYIRRKIADMFGKIGTALYE